MNGDDFGFLIDDESLLTGYRPTKPIKLKLIQLDSDKKEDYIRYRLFLARILALIKASEKRGL